MEILDLEKLWDKAFEDILGVKIDPIKLSILALQTRDSIRRIQIYGTYKLKAQTAVKESKPFFHTSNPFVLTQRVDLSFQDKVWFIYLATYFGKSNRSGWELFKRAAFKKDLSLITFNQVNNNLEEYFEYLLSFDFFKECTFSNHRKFTAKSLLGHKGLFISIEFLVNNIHQFCPTNRMEFHRMFLLANKIPNFGRLAAFDFSSSLAKIGLIDEPKSMYAENSTGPLKALELMLKLTNNEASVLSQKEFAVSLMCWFLENSNIFMVGQVLEDAICNWQKDTTKYRLYKG